MDESTVSTIEVRSNAVIVHVKPESLDEDSFWALRSDVLTAGSQSPKLPVVLDMAKVSFVPSLSLGGLIQLAQEFKVRPQRLLLASVQVKVRETMSITRVETLFEILDDTSKFA